MSEKKIGLVSRRAFLTGGAGLTVLPLAGCIATPPEKPEHHYVMVFDQNKCVGCGDCKRACNRINELPEGISRVILQRAPTEERHYIRVSCQQCENAPCARVCPTAACHRDEKTGLITMDPDKCVGCKYCITACPYNARFINAKTRVAENCDFCMHKKDIEKGEQPSCVDACRFHALEFGDLADECSFVSRLLKVKDTVRVRPWLGTQPRLRYIPVVKKGV